MNMMPSSWLVNGSDRDHLVRECEFDCHLVPFERSRFSIWFEVWKPRKPYCFVRSQDSLPLSYEKLEDMIGDFMKSFGKDYETARKNVHIFHTLHLPSSVAHN